MAMAERHLRTTFGPDVMDHHTFVIAGDGCFMEGVSHEAASLAGHQQLGNLICIYDDNHVTIDGVTELALSDDVGQRFEAYGWHVEHLGEIADDCDALEAAIRAAMEVARPAEPARPAQPHRPRRAPTSPTTPRPTATRSPPSRSAAPRP